VSDEELLEHLKRLYAEAGQLSGVLIDQAPDMLSSATYRSRFGSLARAYEMIGYRTDRDQERIALNKRLRALHPEIIARIEAAIAEVGGTVVRDPKIDLLTINNEMVSSLVLARCQPMGDGRLRWRIRFDSMRYQADITLAVRLDSMNRGELDYYLLPRREQVEMLFIAGVNKRAGIRPEGFAEQFSLSPALRDALAQARIILASDADTTLENAIETACWLAQQRTIGP
jgi:hypothetical protein